MEGYLRSPPPALSSPDPPAGVCPSEQQGWAPPPATSFLSRVSPSVQRGPAPPLESPPPRDMNVLVYATWAGTSSRPSHPPPLAP
jgi:hypothetical protein